MPLTTNFKCRSLIIFALLFELAAMCNPSEIRISMPQVYAKMDFDEHYCICGAIKKQEINFKFHLHSHHHFMWIMFKHMNGSHLPVLSLELEKFQEETERSKNIGSIAEQMHRIQRILYLKSELPGKMKKWQNGHHNNAYTYQELDEFQQGKREFTVPCNAEGKKVNGKKHTIHYDEKLPRKHLKTALIPKYNPEGRGNSFSNKFKQTGHSAVDHESGDQPFRTPTAMPYKQVEIYVEKQHQKTEIVFGTQKFEDRIRQVPKYGQSAINDCHKIILEYPNQDDIPILQRLEIRQKACLGIQLELFSIFQPNIIGPQLMLLLEKLHKLEYQQFLCACTAFFKDEPSYHKHLGQTHRNICEKQTTFTEVFDQIPTFDFDLLGDTTNRRDDLLDDWMSQKVRISKLLAIRKLVKLSVKTKSKLCQEFLKRRNKGSSKIQNIRKKERTAAADYFNDIL